jgi:hypothetical protein
LFKRKFSIIGVLIFLFICLITIYRLEVNNVLVVENQAYYSYLTMYYISIVGVIISVLLIISNLIVRNLKQ